MNNFETRVRKYAELLGRSIEDCFQNAEKGEGVEALKIDYLVSNGEMEYCIEVEKPSGRL